MATAPVIGLAGLGLNTYWPQFAGLHDRLVGYQHRISDRLKGLGATVTDVGLVDDPALAPGAGERLRDADLIFLNLSTYALSSTVLPLLQKAGRPVVVLNLQPVAAIDYAAFNALGDRGTMTGEWLAHCQACSVPEIAAVLRRVGIPFHVVTGVLDDDRTWAKIGSWVAAARVVRDLGRLRLGLLGHYYGGMLDVYSDLTRLAGTFGVHHEILEMDELVDRARRTSDAEIAAVEDDFRRFFSIDPTCTPAELRRAARTTHALQTVVAEHRLGALAYYHEGVAGDASQDLVTSVIPGFTLLTSRGIPVAGEYEVKNALAMRILQALGAGGSFSEFYCMDFTDDVVLLGHDGPAHGGIAEGPVGLVPLPVYHGKPGQGLSIQMRVRNGPVTLLSVVEGPEGVSLLFAEGQCVPGPTLAIGNTNSRYRFPIGATAFIEAWSAAGPAHHCAIGIGHHADTLARCAALWRIPATRVC